MRGVRCSGDIRGIRRGGDIYGPAGNGGKEEEKEKGTGGEKVKGRSSSQTS